MGRESTRWRTDTWGMTWTTQRAAACAVRRDPGSARQAQAALLATKGDQLVVATVSAAQAQEAAGQDAALEECVELVLDELRQIGA